MTIGERIKMLREAARLSQDDLSKAAHVSRQNIYKYEKGIVTNIPSDKIERIAEKLGVTGPYLLGWEDKPSDAPVEIPVLGQVAAGKPIIATEYIEGYEEIPRKLASTGDFFALRIHGDSMSPKIEDGDIVIVKRQNTAEDGKIVIALVEDNEAAVCKRLKIYDKNMALWSINPNYSPISATPKNQIKIIGEVVQIRRNL